MCNKKKILPQGVLWRVLPLVLGLLLLSACSEKPAWLASLLGNEEAQQQGPQALPVTVQEVAPTTIPYTLEVMAQTEGAKETEVRARVG
ncbi:MAG: hypothetical protein LBO00_05815, partial [Zoogloeaceae bacterium]|nr:hypothetical protein [Zoogloeaceae bacterium]